MSVLIVAETKNGNVIKASLGALRFGREVAQKLGVDYHILVMGKGVSDAGAQLAKYGAAAVHVADDDALADYLSESYAKITLDLAEALGAKMVCGAATSNSKDFLPRVAAKIGAGMASDVIGWNADDFTFDRPTFAGSLINTVEIATERKVATVRGTGFEPLEEQGGDSEIKQISVDIADALLGKKFVALHAAQSDRPELTEASMVVSGGRGTKNKEGFEAQIFPVADLLGAAVGATRSAVDSGFCGNELQVGQTGKIVAPDLYIAAGISGAIQHLAGMKDSKVIVAINKDEEAPIFSVADYGLVADLFQALPELVEEIKKVNK